MKTILYCSTNMGKPFLLEYLKQLNKPATAKSVYELYVKSVYENYHKRLDANRNKTDVLICNFFCHR